MDYDTGFVIAPDTVRFRQRRVEKPMLCHELFYCAEVRATPFLTRTQVQEIYPLADFVAEWEGAGVAFFQLAALKAEYEVMQVATLHRDAAVVALHQQYAALLG